MITDLTSASIISSFCEKSIASAGHAEIHWWHSRQLLQSRHLSALSLASASVNVFSTSAKSLILSFIGRNVSFIGFANVILSLCRIFVLSTAGSLSPNSKSSGFKPLRYLSM